MAERRYTDEEVREIFDLATRSGALNPATPAGAAGVTLADIQSVGLEVGLDPALVARAAASLDNRPAKVARSSFGLPVEVGRVVPLERALTDHEWEQLVGELRATFRARGRVVTHGSIREWSNGNLHALVEPSGAGYRLRIGTRKGDAAGLTALGATGVVAGGIAFASLALSGEAAALVAPVMISTSGVGVLLANALRLPRWARQRERQMDHIADRIRSIAAAPSADSADA